jgi:hypothetical protein
LIADATGMSGEVFCLSDTQSAWADWIKANNNIIIFISATLIAIH